MVGPAPRPHGRLLQRPQPGIVLRVSHTRTSGPTASTKRRVSVATPDKWRAKFSAVRSAVRIEASGPLTSAATVPGHEVGPVGQVPLHGDLGVDLGEGLVHAGSPGEHALDPRRQPGPTPGARRDQ